MELYDVCQEHKLPYSVSGIKDHWLFLNGGIEFRKGLLKQLGKQIKAEGLSMPEPSQSF
jgi:hypothetical protein